MGKAEGGVGAQAVRGRWGASRPRPAWPGAGVRVWFCRRRVALLFYKAQNVDPVGVVLHKGADGQAEGVVGTVLWVELRCGCGLR